MSQESLSVFIRTAFEQTLRSKLPAGVPASALEVDGIPIAELPARVHGRVSNYVEQDRLWVLALRAYRRGPADLWAPVILEMLAPALLQTVVLLQPLAPIVDEEDLAQQLLLETLETAATIPIRMGRRYIERRLILRAFDRTLRWLSRQHTDPEHKRRVEEARLAARSEEDPLNKRPKSLYALGRKQARGRRERSACELRGMK